MKRSTLLLSTLVLAAFAAMNGSADTLRHSFPVSDGGTLTLEGGFGNVRVVTGGSGVAVEVERDVSRLSSSRAAEVLRDFEVTFDQSGNDVHVRSRYNRESHWFQWSNPLRVQYNVRVPSHYNVVLTTSGGDIDLSDLQGNAECRTSGGDVKIAHIGGNVVARTSGGDLGIAAARGNVDARTSGGSIDIGDASGTVDARTSGGSIEAHRLSKSSILHTSGGNITIDEALDAVDATTSGGTIRARMSQQPRGDSKLSTSGGDVVVELTSTSAFSIDAHASGGEIDSDVPVTVQGRQDEHSLNGVVNGGGPKLVLRTSGGGIRLKRS